MFDFAYTEHLCSGCFTVADRKGSEFCKIWKTQENIDIIKLLSVKYFYILKQILEIGRNETNIKEDDEKMIEKFKQVIQNQDQFYNTKKFPENESEDICDNEEGMILMKGKNLW